MKEAKNGDTIFYCDSGSLFIRKPDYVYNNLSEDNPMFCCDIPLIESCFTKPICFEKMNCKGSLFFDTNQIIATYFCLYVCDKTRRFVDEWLNYCCDIELMKPEGTINLTEKNTILLSHTEKINQYLVYYVKNMDSYHTKIYPREVMTKNHIIVHIILIEKLFTKRIIAVKQFYIYTNHLN